ncbi:NDR1/HIN1-like protein 12 [Rutidosis leptorrhynchoides]|uniref:NDR1/HIN1-like protein 12 n=1 Tax=Rutidosis leptorrhynchoides TaxID=125765 RepID=UPI003A9A5DC5
MTEKKDCGHHEKEGGPSLGRLIFAALLAFIIIILFIIFLVWAILRPTKPRFLLQDATIYAFNVTPPNFLTSNIQVTISTRNPNGRIGIFYEKLDIYASYRNQQVTLATEIPRTYQGHKDIAIWSPFLYGNSVPISPYFAGSLSQDQSAGLILLSVKIYGKVKWKVGTWVSGKYRINVNCPAYISFSDRSKSVVIGSAIKYQIVQSCSVDVSN